VSDEAPDGRGGREPRPPEGIEEFDLDWPEDMDVRPCYRHPQRETGVSCSNCGRPICYECMTPAPVGFRCPECMAEQRGGLRVLPGGRARQQRRPPVISRQQTRARWQGGLRVASGNPVTRVLLAINIVVFLLELATSLSRGLLGSAGGWLVLWGGLFPPSVALDGEYWRLLTPMFLHANLIHLLFNMWALYVVGSYLEMLAGRVKYLLLYFLSGIAGNVLVYVIGPRESLVIGASTAIFGLFGALFVYSFNNRHTAAGMMLRSTGFLIVINLLLTFSLPGISWQGHVGGLLGGMAVMEALSVFGHKDLRSPFERQDIAAVGTIVGILVLLVVVRTVTF